MLLLKAITIKIADIKVQISNNLMIHLPTKIESAGKIFQNYFIKMSICCTIPVPHIKLPQRRRNKFATT